MKTLPLAIFICGLPGAGKTLLAKMICKNMPSLLFINNDDIRNCMEYPVIGSEYTVLIYKYVANIAKNALSNDISVVMDATFYSSYYRAIVLDAIQSIQILPLIINVVTPVPICRQRVNLRPNRLMGVDNVVTFDRLLNHWENWSTEEIPKNSIYIEIDGSGVAPNFQNVPRCADVDVINLLKRLFKERMGTNE